MGPKFELSSRQSKAPTRFYRPEPLGVLMILIPALPTRFDKSFYRPDFTGKIDDLRPSCAASTPSTWRRQPAWRRTCSVCSASGPVGMTSSRRGMMALECEDFRSGSNRRTNAARSLASYSSYRPEYFQVCMNWSILTQAGHVTSPSAVGG